MNTQIGSLRRRTDSHQLNRLNEASTENTQVSQSNLQTRASSPALPNDHPTPLRNQHNPMFEFEQSFNRLLSSSLSFKEQKVDEIIHLSKMISPKKVHGDKKINSYNLNINKMNHAPDTKIIIPLVQLPLPQPLPLFKIETKDNLLGKKTSKSSSRGMKKKANIEITESEETKEKDILISEIEKSNDNDIEKEKEKEKENEILPESEYQPALVQTNQSNVYNVNITNVNINYNNSTPNKNIIKEIKSILLEKGLKYDSTHEKDSKDLKFSIGDYGYLIRQDKLHEKFLCFVRTYNHSNRDKDVVHTNECDIIKELKLLKEDLQKVIRK